MTEATITSGRTPIVAQYPKRREEIEFENTKPMLLTKSEMKVIADELGLRQKIGAGFAKLFAKSKTDLVTALLAVDGFDYAGKLPKVLRF